MLTKQCTIVFPIQFYLAMYKKDINKNLQCLFFRLPISDLSLAVKRGSLYEYIIYKKAIFHTFNYYAGWPSVCKQENMIGKKIIKLANVYFSYIFTHTELCTCHAVEKITVKNFWQLFCFLSFLLFVAPSST